MTEETEVQQLDRYWSTYTYQVRALAEQVFEAEVKPFCQQDGYEFNATSGTWWIGPPGCKMNTAELVLSSFNRYPGNPELQSLHDLLSLWIPGMMCSLGSLMPDFKPEARETDR